MDTNNSKDGIWMQEKTLDLLDMLASNYYHIYNRAQLESFIYITTIIGESRAVMREKNKPAIFWTSEFILEVGSSVLDFTEVVMSVVTDPQYKTHLYGRISRGEIMRLYTLIEGVEDFLEKKVV